MSVERDRHCASAVARLLCCGLALLTLRPENGAADRRQTAVPVDGYRVLASYPHDPEAFTQGLAYADGQLFESLGNYGKSALRRVDLTTGRVAQETRLAPHLFGEGLAHWQGTLVQLTWRERLGLVYDLRRLTLQDTFAYAGEGWGLTHDATHWIMSDGSATLHFLDPRSRHVAHRITVRDGTLPVRLLNELEFVDGEIWANIWQQEVLVRIAPDTGAVTGYLDLDGLYPVAAGRPREAVLNGIAHDAATGRIFVTGKYWPRLYCIESVPNRLDPRSDTKPQKRKENDEK